MAKLCKARPENFKDFCFNCASKQLTLHYLEALLSLLRMELSIYYVTIFLDFFWPTHHKSLLEALIVASNIPRYDKRLFIDLPVQYMKHTSSEHVVLYINCSDVKTKTKFMNTTCSELSMKTFHVLNCKSMNNFVILWVRWCKNKCFWKRFTCTYDRYFFSLQHCELPKTAQNWKFMLEI